MGFLVSSQLVKVSKQTNYRQNQPILGWQINYWLMGQELIGCQVLSPKSVLTIKGNPILSALPNPAIPFV
jgi:hypothetical protein